MNASDIIANQQRCTLLSSMPIMSTLGTASKTIRSTIGGPATTVIYTTSTLQVATCGISLTYETLAAGSPINPEPVPFVPQSTLIKTYREVYSSMTSPSTTLAASTYVQLGPTANRIC